MGFWHFLRVDVGVGPYWVTIWAPVSFPHLLQPVQTLVRLPQPVLAVDNRHFHWQSSFGFESTGAPSAQQQNEHIKHPRNAEWRNSFTFTWRKLHKVYFFCLSASYRAYFYDVLTNSLNYLLHLPFTCIAFTKFIVFPKKTISIVTWDFLSWFNVPQHLHTGCIPSCWHKLNKTSQQHWVH